MTQFSVRLSDELHDRLRQYVFDERTTLQETVTAALIDFLADAGGKAGAGLASVNATERNRLTIALDLMRHGEADLRRLLKHLLDYWALQQNRR